MIPKRLNPRYRSGHRVSALIQQGVNIGRVLIQTGGSNACHIKAGDRSIAATTATACPIVTGCRATDQDEHDQEKTLQALLNHLPMPHYLRSPPAYLLTLNMGAAWCFLPLI
jgi:hypothetical protein